MTYEDQMRRAWDILSVKAQEEQKDAVMDLCVQVADQTGVSLEQAAYSLREIMLDKPVERQKITITMDNMIRRCPHCGERITP